jgi:hypothetical protein
MSVVRMEDVVAEAAKHQAQMHKEREELPSSAWEIGDAELVRFAKTAWPTPIGQKP